MQSAIETNLMNTYNTIHIYGTGIGIKKYWHVINNEKLQ